MKPAASLRLWDLIEQASALEGATKLHLAIGRPPMVRMGDEDLQPLDDALPTLGFREIQFMLDTVVYPDRWDQLEHVGQGEIPLSKEAGRPLMLTLYKASECWCAVVHL